MYSDPQSVTVNAVAIPLPRTSFGANSGAFNSADGNTKMTIAHQYGKRTRRTVRLDFRKIATDPLLDGVSREYSDSVYLVIDHPVVGFSTTEVEKQVKALTDLLGTAGYVTKLLGGES